MGIVLTKAEKAELAGKGFAISVLPDAQGCAKAIYHNPKTGQEFRLLADPGNMAGYTARGLRLGPAPAGMHYELPSEDPADEYKVNQIKPGEIDYIALLS